MSVGVGSQNLLDSEGTGLDGACRFYFNKPNVETVILNQIPGLREVCPSGLTSLHIVEPGDQDDQRASIFETVTPFLQQTEVVHENSLNVLVPGKRQQLVAKNHRCQIDRLEVLRDFLQLAAIWDLPT